MTEQQLTARNALHKLAGLEQGVTAPAKLRVVVMGQDTAGGGVGGGGDGAAAQEASAVNVAPLTPAPRMAPICEVMHAPMTAVLVGSTRPVKTKGVARATAQLVQALAVTAHGVTAAAKLCVAETGQVAGAGAGGGGDGAAPQEARAVSVAPLTPAPRMAPI